MYVYIYIYIYLYTYMCIDICISQKPGEVTLVSPVPEVFWDHQRYYEVLRPPCSQILRSEIHPDS